MASPTAVSFLLHARLRPWQHRAGADYLSSPNVIPMFAWKHIAAIEMGDVRAAGGLCGRVPAMLYWPMLQRRM